MNVFELKKYIHKDVEITTIKDSKYLGIINKINVVKRKCLIIELIVLHKNGSFKAVSGNANQNKRWFNIASIVDIKEKYDKANSTV